MSKTKKEVYALYKLQEKKLKDAINKTHPRPCSNEMIKEVIRLKKIVNALSIEMWEFSLND
tara:strand:- start:2981 stop:3163 length:183 start_codon:yes stop_codon:yes gene_type:complete